MDEPLNFLQPEWPAPHNVHAAVTTRVGGYSRAPYDSLNLGRHCGDDPAAVVRNRQKVMQALALSVEPQWLNQAHGSTVLRAPLTGSDEADGIWTQALQTPCAVMMADCLPVLFCDIHGRTVAAAHAGWRGLAGGVLESTVAAMPAAPQDLLAWLGPAIGPSVFEVGAEVRTAFVQQQVAAEAAFSPGRRADSYMADLCALARLRLASAGVTRVSGGGRCTYTEADRFFSYRRDGATGRMAALVWLSAS